MKLLKVDTIEKTRNKIIQTLSDWELKTERIPLSEALDRILAEDIISSEKIPAFNRSTV